MKIAGLAMALCIVMLGIYIVVPKDGTVYHLTAIPDNNAAEPVTDSTSEGTADADFPIYTEDSYSSEPESSDDTGDGDSYTEEPTYDPGDNSYDGNTDSEANGVDTSVPGDSYTSFIPQEGKEGQEFYKFERLILQAVVRYGEKVMCNLTDEEGNEIPVTVIEYVVNDLKEDDLAFHNPLHRQILTEAATHIHDAGFIAERYFLAHPDQTISRLSVDLINVRYQLSKYHSKSQKIVTDEERLYELVPMLMINFKYAIVTEELKHMLYALQDPALAHDNEKCNSLMQRYNEMREVQSLMAKRLGDRVVLR